MKFRFQDLKIWKYSIELSDDLLDIADFIERKRMFRFAEQLRGASMSISNNIAEGSGSTSNVDFDNFLKYSRRSAFECANILIILNRRKLITEKRLNNLLEKLDIECRMIISFKKSL